MPTIPATMEERAALRPIGRNSDRYQMMIEELREIVTTADELGYTAFGTTEHHFHSEGGEALPNPLLLYSDFVARTKNITMMPFSIVPGAGDPIRIAEDLALFDQMTKGRVAVCFARGYQKRWIQILSQGGPTSLVDEDSDRRNREKYDEYVQIIKKAWTEDSWDYNGKYYQVPFPYEQGITGWAGAEWTREYGSPDEVDENGTVRRIGVTPPPYTKPHPQIFVPFTLSPKTLIDAAHNGYTPIMYEGRADKFHGYCKQYQDEAAKAGFEYKLGENVGAVRSICLGRTYDEAFDLAAETAAYEYHNYFNKFGMGEVFRTPEDPPNQMVMFKNERDGVQRMIDKGQLFVGTPDDVKRELEKLYHCHGTGSEEGELEWLSWTFFAQGLKPRDVQRAQLEMFANEVWPEFKDSAVATVSA
jgi:alkanesulfonate monooxygenase SsuD/methylene tetrahydromethanopterin reductase-like flavin-dependent oxidoreductase (luciferase family)